MRPFHFLDFTDRDTDTQRGHTIKEMGTYLLADASLTFTREPVAWHPIAFLLLGIEATQIHPEFGTKENSSESKE